MDWDSSFGIAIRYGLGGPGVEPIWEEKCFAPVQTHSLHYNSYRFIS